LGQPILLAAVRGASDVAAFYVIDPSTGERGKEFLMRTPMKRFGKVEELAGAAVFLASDAASFVTGEILVVDGGFLAGGVNQ
jgi:NAD(P)-dependent dehydrogenase (short-subunit alcohol dehydrogenase family)